MILRLIFNIKINMFQPIIYLLATTSLLIGSILTFDNSLPDYFYLIGTILFVLNSMIHFKQQYYKHKRNLDYGPLLIEESYLTN
jgi:hypothetical protein